MSANTGSKLMKASELLKSENFVFSPDMPPAKQTHELILKNFRVQDTDFSAGNTNGEDDNPFGLTSRESEAYVPGTTNPISSRKLEAAKVGAPNILTSAADSSPGSGISSSLAAHAKGPAYLTGHKPTTAMADGSASNFLAQTQVKATAGASQSQSETNFSTNQKPHAALNFEDLKLKYLQEIDNDDYFPSFEV